MFQRPVAYQCFTYLGTVATQPVPLTAKVDLVRSGLSRHINNETIAWLEQHKGDYVSSKSTQRTIMTSVLKMDRDPCYEYLLSPFHGEAVEAVAKRFAPGLSVRPMTRTQLLMDMELDKSAGTIEAWRGLRTKGDCMLAGVDREYDDPAFLEEIPIWKVAGKIELRTRHDYHVLGKQRTFIIQPFGQYWVHKKVYGNQQQAMKGVWWSAYGFNPYEGGCDRLARRINRMRRKIMGDVVGWDRLLPHMDDIYRIKNRFLEVTPEMEYATYHAINSRLHLPNGDLVEKSWGNNSGSGSTTIDNIIGMAIVVVHVYLYLGLPETLLDSVVDAVLFGDDFLVGDNLDCSDEDVSNAFKHVFGLYGLTLDPFVISNDITDMSFLGFNFARSASGYVPKYSLERLAAPMLYNEGSMHPNAEFTKMVSLMLMSAGNGEDVFQYFYRACSDVIFHSDVPEIKQLVANGWDLPTYDQVICWYLGLESSRNHFLEDGRYKVIYDG